MYMVIVALNVGVLLMQHLARAGEPANTLPEMLRWGANIAPLTLAGEPTRLLTSMFLHAGLLHLALNMYMLVALGGAVERAFGTIRFTVIYLVSGLWGGVLSALWYAHYTLARVATPDGEPLRNEPLALVVSVGASGALMGIAGASLAHWLVVDRHNNQSAARNMRNALLQTIAMTLLMGALLPAVDNAAHIGGLLAGMVLGSLLALAGLLRHVLARALATAAACGAALLLLLLVLRTPPAPGLLQLKAQLLAISVD